jgi:Holliday junction resolvasome RuvABC endonuclease subunit
MNYSVGIDPGQSGGIGIIDADGSFVTSFKFKDQTDADISEIFRYIQELQGVMSENSVYALLEKVHSMPKQGVASSFTFGMSFGFLKAMLTAHKIPWDFVQPNTWQKALGCQTHGDKNITKSKAQRQWPGVKITHANADALLIAEYCRITKK